MIGIHEPDINKDDQRHIFATMKSKWISTSGQEIIKFENKIKNFLKSNFVICTNSGTSALHIAIKLLRPSPGDEILVPTITFVSPINAVLYNNCSPIFFDCKDNLNIDEDKVIEFLEKKTISIKKKNKTFTINRNTKKRILALVVTHVFGQAVELSKLINICKKKNIKIIEDAAESFGSKYYCEAYKKIFTATLADIGCLSFNGNKIITTGSGGAIVTNNKKFYEKAKYLCSQAKNDGTKFIHNEVGYNYKMNNIQASLGISQINRIKKILKKKKQIIKWYQKYIKKNAVVINNLNQQSNNWLALIKFTKKIHMDLVLNFFKKKSIQVRPIWYPNHLQKYLKKYQKYKIEKAYDYKQYYCLPSSPFLNEKDIKKISAFINAL